MAYFYVTNYIINIFDRKLSIEKWMCTDIEITFLMLLFIIEHSLEMFNLP